MTPLGNRLLDALPPAELEQIQPDLSRTCLRAGAIVEIREQPPASLYFPVSAAVSLLARTRDGESVEIALAGRDGMIGAFEAIGQTHSPFAARVQIEGDAWRLPVAAFRRHLNRCGDLLTVVHGYLQCLMIQVAQSAICNRFHTSEQRLARWLLTTAVVSDRDTFMLTHEQIAQMVGGTRSAITAAAAALRDGELVDYSRGRLTILNHRGLEKVACECFGVVQEALSHGCVPSLSGRVA